MSAIRTRYAPSPTGYMHIGNLRTALYEYLIARKNQGEFILRIEDTDQDRLVEGATDFIYRTLESVGMDYDEGPLKGGPYGPYVQSERLAIYAPYGEDLVKKGEAYYCFCTKERLEDLKSEQEKRGEFSHYDRCCRDLNESEVQEKLKRQTPYVIRQKMPREGFTVFKDEVFGEIRIENKELEDQVLIKSDKFPTYNFANVIDDHLMKITHVIRGSEYLTSTPKYKLLYNAFGWEIPTYVHLPLILNENGQKLSKRHGDLSFEELLEEGYLPEAITNFIALLGWSPGQEREFFTLKELEETFDTKGISKAPSVFDRAKLKWMNGEYLRKMSEEEFFQVVKPYIEEALTKPLDMKKIAKILQKRTEVLGSVGPSITFLNDLNEYSTDFYIHKKMKTDKEIALASLEAGFILLEQMNQEDFCEENIHRELMELASELGIKNGQLLWPLRVAVTGQDATPGGAIEIIDILGKEESLRRIGIGINKLKEEVGV